MSSEVSSLLRAVVLELVAMGSPSRQASRSMVPARTHSISLRKDSSSLSSNRLATLSKRSLVSFTQLLSWAWSKVFFAFEAGMV